MGKKSIFSASFEESLNLEDDGFLQYLLKEQNKKALKLPKNGYKSLKIRFTALILTLLFPFGLNFLVFAVSLSLYESNPDNLAYPISSQNFLPAGVYLIGLLVWLLLVMVGKKFNRNYILPYRFRFHTTTFLLWFIIEFNLFAMNLATPLLSLLGIFVIFSFVSFLSLKLFIYQLNSLKQQLFGEKTFHKIKDKISVSVASYGVGFLSIGIIIKWILRGVDFKFSAILTGIGLLLSWIVINLGFVAMLIFYGVPVLPPSIL